MKPIIFTLCMIFISCSEKAKITGPITHLPSADDLQATISYKIVHHDSFVVYSNQKVLFNDNLVKYIRYFNKDIDGEIIGHEDISVSCEQKATGYYMIFSHGFTNKTQPTISLELYFYFNETDFRKVLLNIDMYKYPINSASIYFTADSLLKCSNYINEFLQGFDISNNYLFLHPTGPSSFYQISLSNYDCNEIWYDSGSDFIIADYPYIYIDIGHEEIAKYDFINDSLVNQFGLGYIDINVGMAIYDNKVYVMCRPQEDEYNLAIFTLNGDFIERINFSYAVYSITIEDNFLYALAFEPGTYNVNRVIRYNLSTKEFTVTEILDIENWYTIQIHEKMFYYVDYWKRVICRFPLEELKFN